jgi:hypothetical protein
MSYKVPWDLVVMVFQTSKSLGLNIISDPTIYSAVSGVHI